MATAPTPTEVAEHSPSAVPTATLPAASRGTETVRPSPSEAINPCPTDQAEDLVPDQYPPELIGRPFFLTSCPSNDLTIGRIGVPGRLAIPSTEVFRAIDDDAVVTSLTIGKQTELHLWSFAAGARVGDSIPLRSDDRFVALTGEFLVTGSAVDAGFALHFWSAVTGREAGPAVALPAIPNPRVQVASPNLIVTSTPGSDGLDPGVWVVSIAARTARRVSGPTSMGGLSSPERVVVPSTDGTELATTLCATGIDFVGQCQPTTILEIATGHVIERVDLGGAQPVILGADWLVASSTSGSELVDFQGRVRWSAASPGVGAGIWATSLAPDGSPVLEIRSLGGDVRPAVVSIDPASGRQSILYSPKDPTDWHVWPGLSTTDTWAIAGSVFSPPCAAFQPCAVGDLRVADASALDLTTGALTPHGIHITFGP